MSIEDSNHHRPSSPRCPCRDVCACARCQPSHVCTGVAHPQESCPLNISQVIMPTANSSASKEVVTAALLVIGSKILSGRTKDQNVGCVGEYLTAVDVDIKRVRVGTDNEIVIIDTPNVPPH